MNDFLGSLSPRNILLAVMLTIALFEWFWSGTQIEVVLDDDDVDPLNHFKRATWRRVFSMGWKLFVGFAATYGTSVYLATYAGDAGLLIGGGLGGLVLQLVGPVLVTWALYDFVWTVVVADVWAIKWFRTPLREKVQTLVMIALAIAVIYLLAQK